MIFFPKPGDCDLDPSVFQHPECTDVMDFFERRIDNITSTSLYFHEMASTNSMFCEVVVFRCSFQDVSDYRQRALGLIARHLPPYFRTKRRSDAEGTCGILSCEASRSQDFRLQSLRVTFPFQVFFAKLSGNICRTVAVAILVQTGVVLRVGDGTWMNPWMKPYWDQCLNSGEQSFSPFRRYLQPEKMQEKCVVSCFFRKKKTVLRKNEDS